MQKYSPPWGLVKYYLGFIPGGVFLHDIRMQVQVPVGVLGVVIHVQPGRTLMVELDFLPPARGHPAILPDTRDVLGREDRVSCCFFHAQV